MHHHVGGTIAGLESLAAGNACQLLVGKRIDEHKKLGVNSRFLNLFRHPEKIEHAVDVGAELNAVANFTELGRTLHHPCAQAAFGQSQRCRESADTAAGDQNFFRICSLHQ